MRLSILIVNFNQQAYLKRCLESLCREHEVIVVDNHSSDGSVAMLRAQFPWVQLLELPDNLGFAKAMNLAAFHAQNPLLLLLHPDAVLTEHSEQRMLQAMAKLPNCGAMGFRQVDANNRLHLAMGPYPSLLAAWAWHRLQQQLVSGNQAVAARLDRRFAHRMAVGWVSAAAMCIWRQAFQHVNGFDENYFVSFADIDLCMRLHRQVGPIVYEPSITIQHDRIGEQQTDLSLTQQAYGQSRQRFWRQYYHPVAHGLLMVQQRLHHLPLWR